MVAGSPGAMLTDQHRQIDVGIKGIIDGSGAPEALSDSLVLLRTHLYLEETVLFPPLAANGLQMPLFVMKREHGQMWPLIENLEAAGAGSRDALISGCRDLLQLLQVHDPKEEMIVYAAADRLAAQRGDGSLTQALQVAHRPAEWVCEMASR
ncbi:MAG TPA: hemerythrin domain-containing protein [Nevskiaceae bacterium]|nr:hemerythrin domain-containing protein [Nevskiaceae bacterium]